MHEHPLHNQGMASCVGHKHCMLYRCPELSFCLTVCSRQYVNVVSRLLDIIDHVCFVSGQWPGYIVPHCINFKLMRPKVSEVW